MTHREKILTTMATWSEEKKQARRDKIKAAWANRTPEAREALRLKKLATVAAKSAAQKLETAERHRAAMGRRTAKPEWKEKLRQSKLARSAEERAATALKVKQTLQAKSAAEVEAALQKQLITAASRTPEQKAAQRAKTLATRAAWSPVYRAEVFAKKAANRAKKSTIALQASIIKASETKMARYGTVCPHTIARKNGTIKTEEVVRAFFSELGLPTQSDSRVCGGKELDGLSADRKIAFEYNGLYHHCEDAPQPRGKDFHHAKFQTCREQGIRLFSIFEDEWLLRQDQVKGFLRAALGKNARKIPGRKTEVRAILDKEAQDFYEAYHIQGPTQPGTCSAGLFVGEELVGAMTFGRHHRGGDKTVLTRLCFKSDVSVIGGSAKLFKFLTAQTGADAVVSWSDNRWSEGGVYKALGFSLSEELPPDYSYILLKNPKGRLSKQSQKKSAVSCPSHLTEQQWARERGLSRIWDCGKIRWEWKK